MMRRLLVLISACVLCACGGENKAAVLMETELGTFEIEVYEERAPLSAENFLYYVDNGLFDGEGFYRVVRPETDPLNLGMQIIQGGRLDLESVTAFIDHETTELSGLSHQDGVISIARNEPGSGSAAFFFISIGDNSFLDYGGSRNPDGQGYAAFGKVVKGMDVVRAIQMSETTTESDSPVTENQLLAQPVKIISAKRR